MKLVSLLAVVTLVPTLAHCGGSTEDTRPSEEVRASVFVADVFHSDGKPLPQVVGREVKKSVQLLEYHSGGCETGFGTETRCSGASTMPVPFRITSVSCEQGACNVALGARECDALGCQVAIVPMVEHVVLTIEAETLAAQPNEQGIKATTTLKIDSAM